MNAPRFDALARRAFNAATGRWSLLAATGVITAAASFRPSSLQAGQDASKAKKRKKRTCKRQVDQCRQVYIDYCATEGVDCNEEERSYLMSCCALLANCKAGASMDYLFGLIF